jgi:GNAT superfamily N-acetyltransferase
LSDVIIRAYTPADEARFLELQKKVFRGLVCLPRVARELKYLDAKGSLVAIRGRSTVGCVALYKLGSPGSYQIEKLAVIGNDADLARKLVSRAIRQVDSRRPRYLKASTPALQPYVDVYEDAGFRPVRRILDVSWDLKTVTFRVERPDVRIERVTKDSAKEASRVWVEGLRPFWDWWIAEEGGPRKLGAWVRKSVTKGDSWIGAFIDRKLVGLTYLRPDLYGKGWAWFNGIYVLPKFRGKQVGSVLMSAAIGELWRMRQKKLSIYTLAFLDHLAPGAILYLKSGAKIEAEHLELQRSP